MRNIANPSEKSKPFVRSSAEIQPVTPGGKFLRRHYLIPSELADVIALIAGIGPEEVRQ
jgi:hypothetical protein